MNAKTSAHVTDYMTKKLHHLDPHASLQEALHLMDSYQISSLAVIEQGDLMGVVSRTDLLRQMSENDGALPAKKVSEVMGTPALTTTPETSIASAAALMVSQRVHRLYVVRNGEVLGVLSTKDLMRVIQRERIEAPISAYMTSPVLSLELTETIEAANRLLLTSQIHGLIVLEDNWPIGIYTQFEALQTKRLPPGATIEQAMSYSLFCLTVNTPLHRAASYSLEMGVRRIVAVEQQRAKGIITDFDLARAIAEPA
jgi:predicted transcriptional regulator